LEEQFLRILNQGEDPQISLNPIPIPIPENSQELPQVVQPQSQSNSLSQAQQPLPYLEDIKQTISKAKKRFYE